MTEPRRGEVVLVRFVFSDETGVRLRPAVVVSSLDYQRGRREAVVAAVTSNVDRVLFGDHKVVDWRSAGLIAPSLVTGILRTIKQDMIESRLGALSRKDLAALNEALRRCLALRP